MFLQVGRTTIVYFAFLLISKKGYGCKGTWQSIQHYTYTLKEQLAVRKDMDVNNMRDYPTLHLDTN
jgi:hypothetical protein